MLTQTADASAEIVGQARNDIRLRLVLKAKRVVMPDPIRHLYERWLVEITDPQADHKNYTLILNLN